MIAGYHNPGVDDQRLGRAIRALRLRHGWRQVDVGAAAGLSPAVVSRMERGHCETLSVRAIRSVAAALDARVELDLRWRGGQLDRLLDERHAALQETVARRLAATGAWQFVAEASFSEYGERGSIDIFAWHPQRRALLVVELKTEMGDQQALLATMDRKGRLAPKVARDRGWIPVSDVGRWLVFEERGGNRRQVARHAAVLRNAFPHQGRDVAAWLADPVGPIRALSFLPISTGGKSKRPRS